MRDGTTLLFSCFSISSLYLLNLFLLFPQAFSRHLALGRFSPYFISQSESATRR